MRGFAELFDLAAGRKGGAEAFEASMPQLKSAEDLITIPDDRWLATFSRGIF
ncbi:MAG: hypothetical protein AAFR17_02705 [Pseudomonadota bacterium]